MHDSGVLVTASGGLADRRYSSRPEPIGGSQSFWWLADQYQGTVGSGHQDMTLVSIPSARAGLRSLESGIHKSLKKGCTDQDAIFSVDL